MKKIATYAATFGLVLVGSAEVAWAEGSCLVTGVPVVNARTEALGAAVTAYMAAGTAQLIAVHEYQTEMLISALKTGVSQTATSNDQVATTAVKSNEAAASAYVSSDQAMQIMEETERYSSLGYDSCGVESSMQDMHAAYKRTFTASPSNVGSVEARPGVVRDPADWYQTILNSSDLSGQSLFNGDTGAAAKFINAVMGPPDSINANIGSTPQGSIFLTEKMRRDARKSVAIYAMDQIAKENASGGLKEAMDSVVDSYMGTDGGETWAASMATSHERGILLDSVRLEAANLASLAYEIRQQQRTELVTATYALSRADKLIGGDRSKAVVVPVNTR